MNYDKEVKHISQPWSNASRGKFRNFIQRHRIRAK
jgi:hypothetical protein